MSDQDVSDYVYRSAGKTWEDEFLLAPITRILEKRGHINSLFEVGCGNGSTAKYFSDKGYKVTGIDPSESGIGVANRAYPEIPLHVGDAYEDLASVHGQFPCVISLEVIEHCYYPRKYMQCISDLLEDGGLGVISTPYHGYWKNLALAVSGKTDSHYTALWDGGHIKFFSIATMTGLLNEYGFRNIQILRVGRIGPLARSMIVLFEKSV